MSTNDAGIFLPNLVTTTIKKQILESVEHSTKVIETKTEPGPPPPPPSMLFCSFKKCGSAFETQQELEDHMQTYHQPPFSPAKQPSATASNVKQTAKKSVKFKVHNFCFRFHFLLP